MNRRAARPDPAAAMPGRQPAWTYGHRGYALMSSLRQMANSRFATLLTLLVLGITMTLPAVFLFAIDDVQQLPVDSNRGQSMTLYLDTAVSDLDGAALAATVEQRPGVDSVEYISRVEALTAFKRQSEFADALDVLDHNPLPGAIVLYPAPHQQSQEAIKLMAAQLQSLDGVDSVQFDLQWVARLSAVMSLVKAGTILLALFLVLTALVVIANTLRLEMLHRSKEMEVTQLLGATRRFVRRPYLYLGALYGLAGGVIAITLAVLVQLMIDPSINRLAMSYGSQFRLSLPSAAETGIILAIAVLLGLAGASVTLYRHLKYRHSAA